MKTRHSKSLVRRAGSTLFAALLLILAGMLAPAHGQATFTKITTGQVVMDGVDSMGCAWVDFNNDGLLDLFIGCWRIGANLLYRNDGGGVFTPITTGAIPSAGGGAYTTSWADIDNDGRMDLFIGRQTGTPGFLFHQESDGSFTQRTLPSGGVSWGSAWADYDNDGFVDLRVGDVTQDILWRNDGRGNLGALAGGSEVAPNAAGVTWVDVNNDGRLDLAITGGGNASPCRVFTNNGNGSFSEVIGTALNQATFGTGLAWGDYDNDGFPDVFVCRLNANFTQALPSFLFHNNGDSTFTQIQHSPFTDDLGFAVSCSWGDYDNDGWLDLMVANYVSGSRNRLYHNNGDGTFTRVTTGPGGDGVGNSVGVIWGDYDRDGFLDLFVSNSTTGGSEPNDYLYHNNGNSNAWITIKCVGSRSNRSAIGANVRVKATINGRTFWQLREINTGDGLSQSAMEAHFGLGNATNVQTLRIEWPSGTVQELTNVVANQYLTVTEPARLVDAKINGVPQFTLHGGRNLQWNIQTSTNLSTNVNWSPLSTVLITNLDGKATIIDTNLPASARRFYRAVH